MTAYLDIADVAQVLEGRYDTVIEWVGMGQLMVVHLPNGDMGIPRDLIWPWRRVSESDE